MVGPMASPPPPPPCHPVTPPLSLPVPRSLVDDGGSHLGPETRSHRRLVADQQPAGLGDRRRHGVTVPRHQRAQVDHLEAMGPGGAAPVRATQLQAGRVGVPGSGQARVGPWGAGAGQPQPHLTGHALPLAQQLGRLLQHQHLRKHARSSNGSSHPKPHPLPAKRSPRRAHRALSRPCPPSRSSCLLWHHAVIRARIRARRPWQPSA